MKGSGGFPNHTYIIGVALKINEGYFHSLKKILSVYIYVYGSPNMARMNDKPTL
jgi:hypothetical protein